MSQKTPKYDWKTMHVYSVCSCIWGHSIGHTQSHSPSIHQSYPTSNVKYEPWLSIDSYAQINPCDHKHTLSRVRSWGPFGVIMMRSDGACSRSKVDQKPELTGTAMDRGAESDKLWKRQQPRVSPPEGRLESTKQLPFRDRCRVEPIWDIAWGKVLHTKNASGDFANEKWLYKRSGKQSLSPVGPLSARTCSQRDWIQYARYCATCGGRRKKKEKKRKR